jgi:hypothetical protein
MEQITRHNIEYPVRPCQIRSILRHIDMSRYYTCCVALSHIVNGTAPNRVDPCTIERLCALFEDIQQPFEKVKPSSRSNFLSYSFVISKLCQMIGETALCEHITLLKSAEKLSMQDILWRKICAELGWEFRPSI